MGYSKSSWYCAIPGPRFLILVALSIPALFAEQNETMQHTSTSISLLITVPLTSNGGEHVMFPGWTQYVSALLAVDHFNDRDPSIVSQLSDLNCDVKFSNVSVMDTGTNSHQAMRLLVNQLESSGRPDAIAGPYNDLPARELSVFATGMEIPIVAPRGVDYTLVLPDKNPYFTQLNADVFGEVDFQAEYLKHIGRTNFIAILYSSEDSVLQRVDLLRAALRSKVGADQVAAFGYISPANKLLASASPDRTIRNAMEMIKETGFRTIVVMSAHGDADNLDMSVAAAELELDQGDHFFLIVGGVEVSSFDYHSLLRDQRRVENGGWLRGAAFTQQFEAWEVRDDNFRESLFAQNTSFVEKVRRLNPVPNYFDTRWAAYAREQLGLTRIESFPPNDILQIFNPGEGATYMYDAVMTIGLGACLATGNQSGTPISGASHLAGIRDVEFHGASGQVIFGNKEGTPGSRVGSTVYFGVVDLLPYGLESNEISINTEYFDPVTKTWVELRPFVYSDGTTSPPELLRDTPEQNYLSAGVRTFGLCLMGMALLTIFVSAVWVVRQRTHMCVIAAQPPFLYVLFLGATMLSLVILAMSFDESYGWEEDMLTKACVSVPWLAVMGDMVCYCALFTKLWRVNKVLKFKRRVIKVRHVAWPAVFVIVATIILLSIWTATGDYKWQRTEIDSVTGESIGRCKGDTTLYFMIPIFILALIPTLLTSLMAWKTSDVDDLYSESKWIFTLVVVQSQVVLVGLPVIAILQDVSTDGRFIGQAMLIWTMPMTTMSLIIGPKMFVVWRSQRNNNGMDRTQSKRGSRSPTPKVSGLSEPHTSSSGRTSIDSATSEKPAVNKNNDNTKASPGEVHHSRIQTVTFE